MTPGGIEARRGQVKRSGIIVVAVSERRGTNTKREGAERRRRRRRNQRETEPAPRNPRLRKVIDMRLKLRFVCTHVACIL